MSRSTKFFASLIVCVVATCGAAIGGLMLTHAFKHPDLVQASAVFNTGAATAFLCIVMCVAFGKAIDVGAVYVRHGDEPKRRRPLDRTRAKAQNVPVIIARPK